MRGITKRYPGRRRQRPHRPRRPARRDPRAARRERRRQDDPHEHPLRAGRARTRARSCSTARPVTIAGPSDAIARGISMVHQHFMLVPVLTVAENIVLGEETMADRIFLDRARPTGGSASWPALRLRHRPRRQGRHASRSAGSSASRSSRRSTATPGSWSSTSRPRCSRPRRPRRSSRVLRRLADERPQHRLHQPQALRGARDRGPHHGHPARPGRRPAHARRDRRGRPRRADGRPRGPADGRPRRVAPGPESCSRSTDLHVKDDRGQEVVRGVELRGPGGRDPRHRRASPATARTSWSRRSSACATSTAGRVTLAGQRHHRALAARR